MFGTSKTNRMNLLFANEEKAYIVDDEKRDEIRRKMLAGDLGAVELPRKGAPVPDVIKVGAIERLECETVADHTTTRVILATGLGGALYLLDVDEPDWAYRITGNGTDRHFYNEAKYLIENDGFDWNSCANEDKIFGDDQDPDPEPLFKREQRGQTGPLNGVATYHLERRGVDIAGDLTIEQVAVTYPQAAAYLDGRLNNRETIDA